MAETVTYTLGGTVQAGGGVYISRQADAELLKLCQDAIFAYVLTPRQMGKSSLMVRTAETLVDLGIRSVIVDLQELGGQVTAEQWYFGFLVKLDDQLMFDTDVVSWWREHEHLGVSQRLTQFFEQVLLAEISERVVVFVDEIDSTLSLDFTDDFFIAVRYLYVARATQPEFNRLSFVLLGVATPGDLIKDSKRTPFNIGKRVDLTDFTFEEALPLADGLGLPSQEAQQVLGWALEWTGGHPYLTQRLCGALSQELKNRKSPINQTLVEQTVNSTFLGVMSEQDNNLQFVRDMLTKRSPDPEVLTIYRQIRFGRGSVIDEEQSITKSHLKLAGIVRTKRGHPYLTQRLCGALSQELKNRKSPINQTLVEQTVNSTFLGVMSEQDNNLQFVRDMLTKRSPDPEVLTIYRQIRFGRGSVIDEEQSITKSHLKLAGIVRTKKGVLRLRNRIYGQVFDRSWINQHLPFNLKDRWEQFKPSLPYVVVLLLLSLFTTATAIYVNHLRLNAQNASQEAKKQKWKADKERSNEKRAADFAREKQKEAIEQSRRAEKQKQLAENQRERAEKGEKQANSAQKLAEQRQVALKISLFNTKLAEKSAKEQKYVAEKLRHIAEIQKQEAILSQKDAYKQRTAAKITAQTYELQNLLSEDLQLNALVASLKLEKKLKELGKNVEADIKNMAVGTFRQVFYGITEHNRLEGHSDAVWSVAFSPDGKTIASASSDKTVKLWNLEGKNMYTFQGHSAPVLSVAFSPDGKTIASSSEDTTIKLWNLQGSSKPFKTFKGHTAEVWSVAFSPDGKTIASASHDTNVNLWDIHDGKLIKSFHHTGKVWSVAFSPDGKTIVSGGDDTNVNLWDIHDGKLIKSFKGHDSTVRSVAFSPDGKTIASASTDRIVKLWNLQGKLIKNIVGHGSDVWSVAFSPHRKIIASASNDNTVKLWNFEGHLVSEFHSPISMNVAFSPDGETIASAGFNNIVKLWSLKNLFLHTFYGHNSKVRGLVFSPDGKIIASASYDHTVKLWNANDGKLIKDFAGTKGHTDLVRGVAFSPDGKIIASASDDKTVKLWNLQGVVLHTLTGHNGHKSYVHSVSFSPDGKTIASAGDDKIIKLWNVNDGKFIKDFAGANGHTDLVSSVAFSPDGKTIASASHDKTVKLWNLQGVVLHTLTGHTYDVNSVAFSPDGKTIASASHDKTVKLWNLQGRLIKTFTGHDSYVWNVAFSPDGKTIASVSDDKTVRLWDLQQGKLLQTLQGHNDAVLSVAFNPDGKTMASGSSDRTIKIWNFLDLDDLLVKGCDWVRDYLQNNIVMKDNRDRHICDDIPRPK